MASSLTDHTSRGFAWMTLQAASAKVTSLAGQVALAYLLFPNDFGLAALASTVMNFAALLQQAGLRQVLVSRGRTFNLWAGPAMWMSLTLGVIAALGMLGVAPLMASVYDQPRLIAIIALMAPSLLVDAMCAVPLAKAQIDLRFKLIAFANWAATVVQMASCVLFAWTGWGPMSFALSMLMQMLTRTAIFLYAVGLPGSSRPASARHGVRNRLPRVRFRRWKYMLGNSAWLFGAQLLQCTVTAAPMLVLGKLVSANAVGHYTFALNISLQSVLLITVQLESVLFATLSKLRDEPLRQARAFLRATGVLALLAIPMCLMQAAAADPLIRLIFEAKWHDAILPVQVLSIAMALLATTYSIISLVNAQGRFRTYFKLALFSLLIDVVCIGAAVAWWKLGPAADHPAGTAITPHLAALGTTAVAVAVSVQLVIYSIVSLHRAIQPPALRNDPQRPSWADVFRTLALPFCVATVSIAPGWVISAMLIPDTLIGLFAQCFVTGTLGGLLYLVLARSLLRGPLAELLQRLKPILSRIPIVRDIALALKPRATALDVELDAPDATTP